jgi:hypothetical protein
VSLVGLNWEWVTKAALSGALDTPHAMIGSGDDAGTILTGSTSELQRFIHLHAADGDAFSGENSLVWRRQ